MFTVFDLLEVMGAIVGLCLGIAFGASRYGIVGALLGGTVGSFFGWCFGRIPYWALWFALSRHSVQFWRNCLERREWPKYKVALVQLIRRGEDISTYRQVFVECLVSGNPLQREIACTVLRTFYPDAVSRIADYNPLEPTDVCRMKIDDARKEEGDVNDPWG